MKQTILVTGATGFLGSHLVKRLVAEGYQVIILKRSFSNTWRINDVLPNLAAYDLDRCNIEQPFQDFDQINTIIHTATVYGRDRESVSQIFEANTLFPLRLLELGIEFATDSFFNTDTFFNKGNVPYKSLPNYSLSKRQFQEWGKQLALTGKIKFINIRLEHIFGPFDSSHKFITYLIKQLLNNVPQLELTEAIQKRDFIYVDDVVSAYILLLNNSDKIMSDYEEYELGTGQAISLKDFIETAKAVANTQTELKFGALPLRKSEIMFSQANTQVLREIGWYPAKSLKDGLIQTIEEEKALNQ
ncbi:MAG: NAD(P)-dependent oxidoreductase [Trichodesmium sp. MAG_R04]|nr:NAD(P)-dependent oxidoreductase [Trichodesmium sp. MAG_R04]